MELAGGPIALTRELNKRIKKPVTYQAVLKWARQGCLPRTEWTGETHYAKAISAAVGGKLKVRELRQRPVLVIGVEPKSDQAPIDTAQAATENVASGVANA
jgi:hypothetical protein